MNQIDQKNEDFTEDLFHGIKVLDFSWVGVGPITTKYFADLGGEVIRIESVTRPDVLRGAPPFKDGVPGINRSQFGANWNTSKKGLGMNLALQESRDLVLKLIDEWKPDIIAESFTPRVMKSWKLDYKSISGLHPEIIYFSTCQMGQTGPQSSYAGFGQLAGSLAGFYSLTGWPDRDPAGPYGAYSDFLNPPIAFGAIIAALMYRNKTGMGQHIDLSQFEGATHFLAPHIMKYNDDGTVFSRIGNEEYESIPHDIYPAKDEVRKMVGLGESWIAISVQTDSQWESLALIIGLEDDLRLKNIEGRKEYKSIIDSAITEWCSNRGAQEIMIFLQNAGIPAGAVQSQSDLWNDPQLEHMKYFCWLYHPEVGPMPYDGQQFQLSETPGNLRAPQAMIGEHNEEILRDYLKLNRQQIGDLFERGVLEHSM